jgi:hypothetical protein
MKKLIISLLIAGLSSFNFNGLAQSPVGFPTGIVVGTGVSIPSGSTYKMAVGGGILTEKIRVATNGSPFWADYVFEPSFKLRSLSEVAKYIKLNKHLPDIPSTAEVTKNGIDLAETQALLLQKVEELTLYVIEQDKQIQKLEKKIKSLSPKKKL